jgi:hypothetical protein
MKASCQQKPYGFSGFPHMTPMSFAGLMPSLASASTRNWPL